MRAAQYADGGSGGTVGVMKSARILVRVLRWSSAAVFAAGLLVWGLSGARLGWTQTSRVTMKQDEITGIDYPERTPALVAGVEIPVAAAGAAAVLVAASLIVGRRAAKQTAGPS